MRATRAPWGTSRVRSSTAMAPPKPLDAPSKRRATGLGAAASAAGARPAPAPPAVPSAVQRALSALAGRPQGAGAPRAAPPRPAPWTLPLAASASARRTRHASQRRGSRALASTKATTSRSDAQPSSTTVAVQAVMDGVSKVSLAR